MFIETGEDLNSPSRVVELMAESPKERRLMADSVPPIVNKSGNEVANKCSRES